MLDNAPRARERKRVMSHSLKFQAGLNERYNRKQKILRLELSCKEVL